MSFIGQLQKIYYCLLLIINKMQMEHEQDQYLQFGVTVDTPPIYFIEIIDINGKVGKIAYRSYQTKIEDLINNYLLSRNKINFKPCFKIIQQGQFYNLIANQSDELAYYKLNLNKASFQVINSQSSQSKSLLSKSIKIRQKYSFKDEKIVFCLNKKKYEIEININESLKSMKLRLIKNIQQLKNQNINDLKLMVDGLYLPNDGENIRKYNIDKGKQIKIILKKNQGCFSQNTQILMSDQTLKSIQNIKIGDQILSYNTKKQSYQTDVVTYVQKQILLKQCIEIVLDNGTSVLTTSNHLLLSEDNLFRSVDKMKKLVCLHPGSKLKIVNQQPASIASINQKILTNNEQFYHLSIKNNHNYIANGLIAHNMEINVILSVSEELKVNVQSNKPFIHVKQQIQQVYQLQVHCQGLYYGGQQILNHQTMVDRNIPKQSNIIFKYKGTTHFNYLHPLCKVKLSNGGLINVCDLKIGNTIMAYNRQSKLQSIETIVNIASVQAKQKMVVRTQNFDHLITTSGDCFLEVQNGQVMNIRDLCYNFDVSQRPRLLRSDGSMVGIKQIAHETSLCAKSTKFYKIQVSSNSLIAQNLIINEQFINIVIYKNDKRYRKVSLGTRPKQTILSIKKRLSNIIDIKVSNIFLSFNNQNLQDYQTLSKYQIRSQHIITANPIQSKYKLTSTLSNNNVYKIPQEFQLQMSNNQKTILKYSTYKDKTVQEIMKEIQPNYRSSYFFLYAGTIINPSQQLNQIQKNQSVSSKLGDKLIILVKNQKLGFIQNMNIRGSEVRNTSYIHSQRQIPAQNLSSRIQVVKHPQLQQSFTQAHERIMSDMSIQAPQFQTQAFYMPFLYLTSKRYDKKIFDYIKNFERYKNEVNSDKSVYSIIKQLYLNMNMLPNYYGKCYYGLVNFKFSHYYQVQNTFYWHSFTLASKNQKEVRSKIKSNGGTFFIIQSIVGKEIRQFSLHPSNLQILFAPFTYFMVEKIQSLENYDVVTLSQISSPITFQKNIVLWVDDQPALNICEIKKILKDNDIQILQVASTILAQKWVKQFGWLLYWKGLQFKLISDMTRYEFGKAEPNKEAGVDLLERLYKNYGISAPTLIYCGDRKNAQINIKRRNIPRQKFFSIATNEKQVQIFCKSQS